MPIGPFVVASLFIIITGTTTFYLVYIFFKTRHAERMAKIENGIPLQEDLLPGKFPFGLRAGIVTTAIGIGIFVANLLDHKFYVDDEVAYIGCILIFGGVSLIVSYLVEMNRIKKVAADA
ncbi:MAG: DUF6249 domain-containing protein [Bacteroidota bacterium]